MLRVKKDKEDKKDEEGKEDKKIKRGRLVSRITVGLMMGVGITLICCQLAFFPISLGAGISFHSFIYILPFAATALFLSLPVYLGCAAVLGLILSIRVMLVPMDYYEYHFSNPIGTIIASVIFALIIWLAMRGARKLAGKEGWADRPIAQRIAILAPALLLASFVLSTVWLEYLTAIYTVYGYAEFVEQMGGSFGSLSFCAQVVFDWLVWLAGAAAVDAIASNILSPHVSRALRSVFGRWLLLVVVCAFLITTTIGYCFSTWQALSDTEALLTSQVGYLLGQADTRSERGEDISELAAAYTFGTGGVVVVTEDGVVVSTNDSSLMNMTFEEIFGFDLSDAQRLDELLGKGMQFSQDPATLGIHYYKVARSERHLVYVSIPAEDVFAYRSATIVLNTLCYFALFAAVFKVVSSLLDHVVVRGFKRTNKVLALITDGDLEQRVDEHGSEEFDAFSDGINATVDALKGWIAEVERRMEYDLETGRAIQQGALPKTFPAFPQIKEFDLFASMDAAREVGGDFYGFFLVDDCTLGFLIADVSGKGIPGALFMMTAKTQIEGYMNSGLSLEEAIKGANVRLCEGNDAEMFVTLWAATLNWETGEVTYVNAGHNYPLLRHGAGGSWEWIKKSGGLFLGTFEMAKYRQHTLMLEPGDELILYTDGVNEAFSVEEEEYGNDRLENFLAVHNDMGPRELVEALRADVAAWAEGAEQSDDITMLCLEYKGPQDSEDKTASEQ